MRDYCIIHLSLGDQGKGVRPQLWYVLLVHVVYKRMWNRLVVLQTAEILGLIVCFAIHFLCVTIE